MPEQAWFFRALSSEPRLRTLHLLKEHPQCVNAIVARLGMTQPAISQHLRVLRETGLVRAGRRGGWVKLQQTGTVALNCPPSVLKECRRGRPRGGGAA